MTKANHVDSSRALIADLYDKYASVLFHKCMRMMGESALAEDAVQQTFFNAFKGIDTFKAGTDYLPWLFTIGTHVCLKMLKSHRKLDLVGDDQTLEVAFCKNSQSIDFTATIQAKRILKWVTNHFDERNQQIFVAWYIDGMNQVQIAESLGISRRAVVKRLTQIRESFEHNAKGVKWEGR